MKHPLQSRTQRGRKKRYRSRIGNAEIQHGQHSHPIQGEVLRVRRGRRRPLERALTIGGYDSAWMADMVAGYILELAKDHFDLARYFGIYIDDGNVAFEG